MICSLGRSLAPSSMQQSQTRKSKLQFSSFHRYWLDKRRARRLALPRRRLSGAPIPASIGEGIDPTQFAGELKRNFSLIPPLDANRGMGIAAGVSRMNLEPDKLAPAEGGV